MKKITLSAFVALAVCFTANAQTTAQLETDGTFPAVITGNTNVELAPCSQMEAGNNGENGFGNTNAGIEVSDDLTVADGEMFSVETATFNMITGGDFPTVDVRFYEDNGSGQPAVTAIAEFVAIAPTSQDVVGTAFGRDILAVVVDFPAPVVLSGQSGSETVFWMSITTPAGTGADSFWETDDTVTSSVLRVNSRPNQTDPWENQFDPGTGIQDLPLAAVYTVEGECDPLLSVGENIADLVSIFPNPTQDRLNVTAPATVKINNAVLYDVLGKDTGLRLSNGTINTSSLARGVYILNISTDRGTLTEKIVKQ